MVAFFGPVSHLIACSHGNGTERLHIVPLFVSLFFIVPLFGTKRSFFKRFRVNATPERSTFQDGTIWNGTIAFPCERGLRNMWVGMKSII